MGNTKGHTSSITGVAWHPKDKNVFVSSSLDATIRVWDLTVNLGMTTITKQKDLIRVKNAQGRKATISCVSFSPDGNWIIGGIEDGSIQLWKSSGPFLRPNTTIKSAHETREGSCITSIKMSRDGSKLLSRAMDNTLKLWNAKSPSKPAVFVWSDLLTLHEETECGFSPDEKTVFTGTSSVPPVASESSSTDSSRDPSLTTGSIVFFDIESGNMIRKIGIVENGDVIACFWHVRLNQIIASCSTGDVKVLYNPQLSVNGACLSVKKAAKRSSSFDYQVSKGTDFKIYTPHALPLFRVS